MNTINEYLKCTKRDGVDELIAFLSESDFYSAPCSTRFHLAKTGGLAEHTLNVLSCALNLTSRYAAGLTLEEGSVIISAICHDFCKINFYKETNEEASTAQVNYLKSLLSKAGLALPLKLNKTYAGNLIDFMLKKYKRGDALPPFAPAYSIEDQEPLGHGEKSIWVASKFIKLTLEEALAIRFHMGRAGLGENEKYAYEQAVTSSKLVTVLQLADQEASFLMEG